MTAPLTVDALTPSHVPAGFALRQHVFGRSAGGFGLEEDQLVLFFAKSDGLDDRRLPLAIQATRTVGAELSGTEGRAGETIDLGDGRTATYHDGIWSAGPGPDERVSGPMLIHWDRSTMHSLTAEAGGVVYGVRGPKHLGVGLGELIGVVRSLPIAKG
jgi:hypothetical protein